MSDDEESGEFGESIDSRADDEAVGFKRPPKNTRFKKGQSGNPRGRPKGSGTLRGVLGAELRKTVEVTIDGKRRKITKLQALTLMLTNSGIKGDMRAAALVFSWLTRLDNAEPGVKPEAGLTSTERAIVEEYLDQEAKRRAAKLAKGDQ